MHLYSLSDGSRTRETLDLPPETDEAHQQMILIATRTAYQRGHLLSVQYHGGAPPGHLCTFAFCVLCGSCLFVVSCPSVAFSSGPVLVERCPSPVNSSRN